MSSEGAYSPGVDPEPTFEVNRNSMVAAIAFLFAAVFFILCVHFGMRFCRQRSTSSSGRRGGSSRRHRFALAGDGDVSRLQRAGLEISVIESLPVFVYQAGNHKDGLECAVCLSEFEEKEKGRLLPKCNHSFHIDCIDMWLHSHSTCPLCRASARPDAPSDDGEPSSTDSATDEEASSSVPVDVSPSEQRGGASETGENDDDLCRHDDGLPSPAYPANVLFWGSQNRLNSGSNFSEFDPGASSWKPLGNFVIEIPRRTDSFSSPRLISGDGRQVYSPGGPSSKSPIARLRSLKLLLSRDKVVMAQSPDGVDIEQGGQAKC